MPQKMYHLFWCLKRPSFLPIFVMALLIIFAPGSHAGVRQFPDGIWLSRGYGFIVEQSGRATRIYQYNPPSGCMLVSDTVDSRADNKPIVKFENVEADSERSLRVSRSGAVGYVVFDKIEAKPSLCDQSLTGDTETVINYLCSAFTNHYAFFRERNIQWDHECEKVKNKVSPDISDEELFKVLSGLIDVFNDRHVQLNDGKRTYYSGLGPVLVPIYERFEKSESPDTFRKYVDHALADYKNNSINSNIHGSIKSGANGTMIWGIRKPNIGYIWIGGFINFLADPTADFNQQMDEYRRVLDTIMGDLRNTDAIIIDLRLSGGGTDQAVLELAGRFSSTSWLVLSKQTRTMHGLTSPQWFYAGPTGKYQYDGPVALLVSNFSVSAAENFGLEMSTRPHPIVIVGEKTAGVHSDVLPYLLPNGWTVTISNEIFRSGSGEVYETRGLPLDADVAYFKSGQQYKMEDEAAETALRLLFGHSETKRQF